MKTTHFVKNRGHGFAQRLFPQMNTAFKGIVPKIFLSWSSNIVHLQRILSEDLYIFITTITLIHLQDQSTCDICGVHHV